MDTCEIEGCDGRLYVKSRGWCRKHYNRWHRNGDPLQVTHPHFFGTAMERWLSKVEKSDDCWLWVGAKDRHGYGQFDVTIDGVRKNHRAHRWGYQQIVRPLAREETLDHLCRVHSCVRPDHLEPVDHRTNCLRGESPLARHARKTHCPRGHEYDRFHANGARLCSTCINDRQRARYQARTKASHCKSGHSFDSANTLYRSDGTRKCRECNRESARESMRKKRAAGLVI